MKQENVSVNPITSQNFTEVLKLLKMFHMEHCYQYLWVIQTFKFVKPFSHASNQPSKKQ